MRSLLKYILSKTLRPFLQFYYLKYDRKWHFKNLKFTILKGVFHPGLFFSSKYLAQYITALDLNNKKILDVGCGSGLLSLVAAQSHAVVTSIDINPQAIKNTSENAIANNLSITVFESDLFENVDGVFDYILVNPPYYAKAPQSLADRAWLCGTEHDYFEKLYTQISFYSTPQTKTLMVLSDVCELEKIQGIAAKNGLRMHKIKEKVTLIEKLCIFEICLSDQ